MAEAEEQGRQPLSAMWRSQGPSPSRVKVYNEEALLDLIKPSTAQGSRVSQTSSFLSRRKAQQRAEKKRLAKEAEQKRVRRYNQQKEDSRMKQAADERKARERVAENANRRERRYEFLRSDTAWEINARCRGASTPSTRHLIDGVEVDNCPHTGPTSSRVIN